MPAALMWFLISLVAVASLLCNSGAWLWMAAKWCRIPNVSYLRALATSLSTIGANRNRSAWPTISGFP